MNAVLETSCKTETESCADWKNCDDREKLSLQEGSFYKSADRIAKFFREIMQDKSNIVFQVIFYIDGDFNNLRKLKRNTISE